MACLKQQRVCVQQRQVSLEVMVEPMYKGGAIVPESEAKAKKDESKNPKASGCLVQQGR
jgi:hypothetical protein